MSALRLSNERRSYVDIGGVEGALARHAEASKVVVNVEDRRERLRLSIIDDGQGFDTSAQQRPGHHGLTNMHARAESLGGSAA